MNPMSSTSAVTIAGWLAHHASERPESIAISFLDERLTFREFEDMVDAVARALRHSGVAHGGRVGVFLPNAVEYLALIVATARIGAMLVPINARFKKRDLAYVLHK